MTEIEIMETIVKLEDQQQRINIATMGAIESIKKEVGEQAEKHQRVYRASTEALDFLGHIVQELEEKVSLLEANQLEK